MRARHGLGFGPPVEIEIDPMVPVVASAKLECMHARTMQEHSDMKSEQDEDAAFEKWQQAQAFCNLTHQIDFAYDGVFWQADVDDFCSTMQVTVPDIIFVGEYT